jgi:transcriptional regulator with XRE-family HTH domain
LSLRKTIGANVATLRKSRSLNQAQLASLLKVNKQTIYRIEAGTTNVGVDTLADLAKALGCEPALLVMGTGRKLPKADRRMDQVITALTRALELARACRVQQ